MAEKVNATHAMPIVNLTSSNTGTELIISGSSDGATCGPQAYYLQVEIICTMSGFQGVANYSSEPITKVNCIEAPYNPVVIPFSDLCPGTTYKWRVRERLTGNPVTAIGSWSATYYFTTPGTPPPPPVITAHGVDTNLLCGNSTTIYGLSTGGCGTITYKWEQETTVGTFISLGNGRVKTVSPSVTTNYIVTGRDTCTGFTGSQAITIYVAPSTSISSFTHCPGETIVFEPAVPKETIGPGSQYTFTDPVKRPIKDLRANTAEILVSGMFATTSKNYTVVGVCMKLTHTKTSDLQIKLHSPSGDILNLSMNNGGTGVNYTNTCFSDTAIRNITIGTAPFNGYFKPQGMGGFASIVGSAVNGTWTLEVIDDGPGNEGSIDNWSITLLDDALYPNSNYFWNYPNLMVDTTLGSPTIVTDTTISYLLTVQYLTCTYTHTFNVNVHPKVLSVDTAPPVCDGDATQLNANGGISYLWTPSSGLNQDNIANPLANPSTTTTYYVTMQDNIGCIKTDSVTVQVGNNPIASAGPDKQVCYGSGVQLNATGGTSYQWIDPDSFLNNSGIANPTAYPTTDTRFYVTVYNNEGCSSEAFVDVQVLASPVFTIEDRSVCMGSSVQLQASSAPNYSWIPSTGLSNITIGDPIASPTSTTTYEVTAVSATCPYTTTVTVTVNPLPNVDAGTDLSVCTNSSVILSATGGIAYSWTPTEGLSDANEQFPILSGETANPGIYTVTGIDANGCSASDGVNITLNQAPMVNAGDDIIICPGSSANLNAAVYNTSGAVNYLWSPSTTLNNATIASPDASPNSTTQYIVIVDNAVGCSETDTVLVIVQGSALNVTPNSIPASCWGGSDGSASVNVSGGTGGTYSYIWAPEGNTQSSINGLTAGLYIVTITDDNSKCHHKETVIINQPLRIKTLYSVQNTSCQINNGSINVLGVENGTAPYVYTVNNQVDIMNLYSGNNILTVLDAKGCQITDTVYIPNIGESVTAGFFPSAFTEKTPAEIFFSNTSINSTNWLWNFGTGEKSNQEHPSMTYENRGSYTVILVASNIDGCSDTISLEIVIEEPLDFIIPNVFTPNGDGKNDVFTIKGKGMSTFNGQIFNRWGKKIYEWENSMEGWNGKESENGVYFYVITFTDYLGEDFNYSGQLTLIR